MEKRNRITRKLFVKWIAGAGVGFCIWIWHRITGFQRELEARVEFRHEQNISPGISYFGKYYLYRTGDSVDAFSTSCTHAGCRIGKINANFLQCSCHGSRFDGKSGKAVRGPAIEPLQKLDCRFEAESGQWIVTCYPTGPRNV